MEIYCLLWIGIIYCCDLFGVFVRIISNFFLYFFFGIVIYRIVCRPYIERFDTRLNCRTKLQNQSTGIFSRLFSRQTYFSIAMLNSLVAIVDQSFESIEVLKVKTTQESIILKSHYS